MSLCCHGNLCFGRVIENDDLYVKFLRIFAHNVQICAKFCKIFNDVCQIFRILRHYTWGGVFCGHAVYGPIVHIVISTVIAFYITSHCAMMALNMFRLGAKNY